MNIKNKYYKIKKQIEFLYSKNPEFTRLYLFLVSTLSIGIFFLLIMGLLAYKQDNFIIALMDIVLEFFLIIGLYIIIKYKKIRIVSEIGTVLVCIHYTILFINGSVDGSGIFWLYTFPLVSIFILGFKKGGIYSALMLTIVLFSYSFSKYIPNHYPYNINVILRMIPSYIAVFSVTLMWEGYRVTTVKKLEEAKKNAEDANLAKTEFISHVTHELRTPLNAIIGFSELLNRNVEDHKSLQYIDGIQVSGKTLLKIINNILDISKIGANKMKVENHTFLVDKLFNDVRMVLNQQLEQNEINFNIIIDKNLSRAIVTDEIKLRQILINLVNNAIKFTAFGSITLQAKIAKMSRNSVDIAFIVADTGIGIPLDDQKLIFEAFSQCNGQSFKQFGGTGLGLTICKKYSELLGGEISLESRENVGSTFTVLLKNIPLSKRENITKTSFKYNGFSTKFIKSNVLIYTQNPYAIQLLITTLTDYNLSVQHFQNIDDLFDEISKFSPKVLILELENSQNINFQKIKGITKQIPVVLISSTFQKNLTEVDDILIKPYEPSSLIEILSKYIDYNQVSNLKKDKKEKISDENINVLQTNFSEDYKKVEGTMLIDDILELSNKIINYGEIKKNNEITKYGKLLFDQTDNFRVEEMIETLKILGNDEK